MNYHDWSILHFFSVIFFYVTLGISIYNTEKLLFKILWPLASLTVAVTGFALTGRFGLEITGPLPMWIIIKISIWLCMSVMSAIIIKKFTKFAKLLFWPWMILGLIATTLSVYKTF